MLIHHRQFQAEIPRLEPHLLNENQAQLAINCTFDSGALRASREGQLLSTMANNPVKGIYTEDGLLFYSWPIETLVAKSPVIGDPFNRLYFLQPSVGTLQVTSKLGMAFNGPSPSQSWKVGVPPPTVAPTLALVDRTTLPDYPSVTISASVWWESAGKRYNEIANSSIGVTTALRAYQLQLPGTTGNPDGSLLKARFVFTDNATSKAITSITLTAGQSVRNNAFPGGIDIDLKTDAKVTITWLPIDTRAYTYVNENTWDEESSNALPVTISPTYVQDVRITLTPTSFTGYRPFKRYNIYRTFGGAGYIRIAPVVDGGNANIFYDSQTRPNSSGVSLESADWLMPVEGLQGFLLNSNGSMSAFKGNNVYSTDPYRPHAWAYSHTFKTNVRGIAPIAGGLVVACADGVYMLVGNYPAAYTPYDPKLPHPGIAQRSMTDIDGAVAMATRDGVLVISGNQGTLSASQKLFTRERWNELYAAIMTDASMRLAYHDGWIIGTSNVTASGFTIRLDEDVGAFTRLDETMDCTFQLPVNDALYYSKGADVFQFRGSGTKKTFTWRGREWIFPMPVGFGCGFIRCTGSVVLKLYADGVLRITKTVTDGYFRLTQVNDAHRWSIELSGTGSVTGITLGRNMRELKRV